MMLRQEFKIVFCTWIGLRWEYKGYFYYYFCAAALFIRSNTNCTGFLFIFMWYSHSFLSTILELYHGSCWKKPSETLLTWTFLRCGLGSQM